MVKYYKAKYIISDGNIYENSLLTVDGTDISGIFNDEQLKQAQNDNINEEIIDYGDAVITPGFINLHTHLQYTDLKPVFKKRCEELLHNPSAYNHKPVEFSDWIINLIKQYLFWSEKKKIKSFKNGLKEAVLSGCTTIVQLSSEKFVPEILDKLEINSFVFLETFANTEESSLKEINKLKDRINKFQTVCSDNVEIGISPHSVYNVHSVLWKEIAKYSAEENILVHTHLGESLDEINWLNGNSPGVDKLHKLVGWNGLKPYEKGLNPVDYLEKAGVLEILKENLTVAHCIQLEESSIEKLVNYGAKIACCPRSNVLLHGKTLNLKIFPEFIADKIGLGTDSRFSNCDLSIMNEAKFVKDYTGLDFHSIISMLTINPAAILKISNKTGSLESGKKADFLVFKLQNNEDYQDILNKKKPDDVYIKGKQAVKSGNFVLPEWNALYEQEES